MSDATCSIKDPHKRFHCEIDDFANWVRVKDTTPYDKLFNKIKGVIQTHFPSAKIMLFGSSAAYLAVKGSDIDIVVYDTAESLNKLYFQTHEKLA
jgi:DNA polymerase sigma